MTEKRMNPDWQQLVDALRAELQEYGAVRNILDQQQKAIFARDAERVGELALTLNQQIEVSSKFRREREVLMRQIAEVNNLPLHTPLAQMRKIFPEAAQPLLQALARELIEMLNTLRRRSRQNQTLLARTCEIMEKTLQLMRPGNFVKTYSSRGGISMRVGLVGSHIQAAG